jgi:hypothetical protein
MKGLLDLGGKNGNTYMTEKTTIAKIGNMEGMGK